MREPVTQTGHYRLAKQQHDVGYYADIEVTVVVEPGAPGLEVTFGDDLPHSWRAGVCFGIAYAFEKSRLHEVRLKRVRVRVTKLHGMVVDTTEVLMAYASSRAFWNALQITPDDELAIDFKHAAVLFPK